MRERYEQGFWPLAVLPLLFAGVAAVVVFHASALALGALVALGAPVALMEVLLWRAMQAKSTSEVDTLWPWYPRLRTALEVLVVYAAIVASGAMKADNSYRDTWPEAVLYSATVFGGLLTVFLLVAWLVGPLDGSSR